MSIKDFYVSSDYAGVDIGGQSFYYGYEEAACKKCANIGVKDCDQEDDDCEQEWCFSATGIDGKVVIPFSEMNQKNQFNVVECLVVGLAMYATRNNHGADK